MGSPETIQGALQTLSDYEKRDSLTYKFAQETYSAIYTLAYNGLPSTDQSLFVRSAEKLLYFVSEPPKKPASILNLIKQNIPDNKEFELACEAASSQIGILCGYIKGTKNDEDSRQRQEYSIRLMNELFKYGDKTVRKNIVETFSGLQPYIIRNMFRGVYGYDKAEFLFLQEFPSVYKFLESDIKKIAASIQPKEFRPRIKAILNAEKESVRSQGKELTKKLLAHLGFKDTEISEELSDLECDLEYTADNIDTIFAIEQKVRGISRWLWHAQGIRHFGRYPEGLILDQFRFIDDTKNPWGIIINPHSDWNGVFQENLTLFNKIRNQLNNIAIKKGVNYRLRIVESESLFSLSKILIRLNRQYGPVSFAIIGGHGTQTSIRFGDGYTGILEKGDVDLETSIRKAVKKFCLADAKIILNSCSTGKENGIAQSLSALGLTVTSPNKSVAIIDMEITQPRNKIQIKASYKKAGAISEFNHGKLIKK